MLFPLCGQLFCDNRQTIREARTHVKSLGTYKRHVWGTVSIWMANRPLRTRWLTLLSVETYELGPLKPGSVYTIPAKNDTRGLKCDCNTVIYRSVCLFSLCAWDGAYILPPSLYSACEACQNASTRAWGQWNQNCDAVYVAQ